MQAAVATTAVEGGGARGAVALAGEAGRCFYQAAWSARVRASVCVPVCLCGGVCACAGACMVLVCGCVQCARLWLRGAICNVITRTLTPLSGQQQRAGAPLDWRVVHTATLSADWDGADVVNLYRHAGARAVVDVGRHSSCSFCPTAGMLS